MGLIGDYTSGKVLEDIAKALHVLRTHKGPLGVTDIGLRMQKNITAFDPIVISLEEALAIIHKAGIIAVGERVCKKLHQDSCHTESVFLDDLAEAMVQQDLAVYSSAGEAEIILRRYPRHPLIISKVSGNHQEICRSNPPECIYWLAEKKGLRCLKRQQ